MELQLPNRGSIKGLGIRRGVTLIVGGGFHGKSTLLEALQVPLIFDPTHSSETICTPAIFNHVFH